MLAVIWHGIKLLDIGYYGRLLKGAVHAIKKLEEKTDNHKMKTSHIDLSTNIKNSVDNELDGKNKNKNVNVFYLIIHIVLYSLFVVMSVIWACGYYF